MHHSITAAGQLPVAPAADTGYLQHSITAAGGSKLPPALTLLPALNGLQRGRNEQVLAAATGKLNGPKSLCLFSGDTRRDTGDVVLGAVVAAPEVEAEAGQ